MARPQPRLIVLGGLGFFGQTACALLSDLRPLRASRRAAADLQIDAEDPASLRRGLRRHDLILDAAGPFQSRTTALIEAALGIGCSVVDINDSLDYAARVLSLRQAIDRAGIRVLSGCSSVSCMAASLLRHLGLRRPLRVLGLIAPASAHTANPGSALSLVRSLGSRVRLWRRGRLCSAWGFREGRTFRLPLPLGRRRGFLFESADSLLLPTVWPSLREVAMYVDGNVPGLNLVLRAAARSAQLRSLLESQLERGARWARGIGSDIGGLGYQFEDAERGVLRCAVLGAQAAGQIPVAPAVLAVRRLMEGRFEGGTGWIPPDRQVHPGALLRSLARQGVSVEMR